jgi:hypothetical protein
MVAGCHFLLILQQDNQLFAEATFEETCSADLGGAERCLTIHCF